MEDFTPRMMDEMSIKKKYYYVVIGGGMKSIFF